MGISVPVRSGKHVVTDGEKLHDPFIQMEVLKSFEQIRVPGKHDRSMQVSFSGRFLNSCECHRQSRRQTNLQALGIQEKHDTLNVYLTHNGKPLHGSVQIH